MINAFRLVHGDTRAGYSRLAHTIHTRIDRPDLYPSPRLGVEMATNWLPPNHVYRGGSLQPPPGGRENRPGKRAPAFF
eukprot:scaffold21834_cov123-Isochrysis_galbana.AAC.2